MLNMWSKSVAELAFSQDQFKRMEVGFLGSAVIETFQVGRVKELAGVVVERYALFRISLRGTM